MNIADFSCVICWAQNYPVLTTRILFSSIAYCTRRGLTKKSNHGGGKEKSLSYLRVLINHILEQIKSEKQTCIQTVSHIKLYQKKIRQTDRQFDIENYTCIIFYAKLSIYLFVCLSDFFNHFLCQTPKLNSLDNTKRGGISKFSGKFTE